MLADFFTKPLQGKVFIRFRDMVMGRIPVATVEDPSLVSTPAQERVGSRILETDERRPDDGGMVTWADIVKRAAKAPPSDVTQRTKVVPPLTGILKKSKR